MCVDVFFVISGFYFAKTYSKHRSESLAAYVRSRVRRLYPPYLIALVCGCIINAFLTLEGVHPLSLIIELLVLQEISPFHVPPINNVSWYVSALLLSSILLWLMNRTRYRKAITAAMLSLVFVYLFVSVGNVHVHGVSKHMIPRGVIRGIMGMGVGSCAYHYSRNHFCKPIATKLMFSISSIAILLLSLFARDNRLDFMIFPTSIMLIITSEIIPIHCGTSLGSLFSSLGEASYWIYLLHNPIRKLLTHYGIWRHGVLYVICTVLLSAVFMFAYRRFSELRIVWSKNKY